MMSGELDQARLIAERIARRVSPGESSAPVAASAGSDFSGELAAVRLGLNALQQRLVQLEARVRFGGSSRMSFSPPVSSTSNQASRPTVPPTHSPWLAGVNAVASHPSQERFGVEEAVVSELVDFFQSEKNCTVEPGGKPCDHCAMCSSRGF